MRTNWFFPVSAPTVLALFLLPGAAREVSAGHYGRNYVGVPTSYVEAYPTSYYVEAYPTSYAEVLPTSYVVPMGYLPTASYLAIQPATVYAPTVWSSPIVLSRSYVQRPVYSYLPTTSAVPTTLFYPMTESVQTVFRDTSVNVCCMSAPASYPLANANTSVSPPPTTRTAPKTGATKPPPTTLDSEPTERAGNGSSTTDTAKNTGPGTPSAVAPEATSKRTTSPPTSSNVTPPDPGLLPVPDAPVAEKETASGTPITPKPPAPAAAKPPVAPSSDPVTLPNAEDAVQRDSMKPVPNVAAPRPYRRTTKKGDLNILEGRVVSSETSQPAEAVKLTIADRSRNLPDQEVVTDSEGRYSVRLPDGEWVVRITMPSGRVYAVSQLIVKAGQINDELGRDIPTLTITR